MDLGAATDLMTQTSAAAGAGGGAVGVVTGGVGVMFVARFLFKRMVDGYDQAIAELKGAIKERDAGLAVLSTKLAVLEAVAQERVTRVRDVESDVAVLKETVKHVDRSAGIAHRRIEAVARGETNIHCIKTPDRG